MLLINLIEYPYRLIDLFLSQFLVEHKICPAPSMPLAKAN